MQGFTPVAQYGPHDSTIGLLVTTHYNAHFYSAFIEFAFDYTLSSTVDVVLAVILPPATWTNVVLTFLLLLPPSTIWHLKYPNLCAFSMFGEAHPAYGCDFISSLPVLGAPSTSVSLSWAGLARVAALNPLSSSQQFSEYAVLQMARAHIFKYKN
jgi:hypothetical protein